MVSAGASQIEIAAAFPDRTCDQIWRRYGSEMDSEHLTCIGISHSALDAVALKIIRLLGKGIKIAGAGEIKCDETFPDYLARTGQTEEEYHFSILWYDI